MKDFANMTHAERMSALTRELNSSSGVAKADKILELIKHELLDIHSMRDRMAARRQGQIAPAPAMPFNATEPGADPKRQIGRNEHQAADWNVANLIHRYKTDERSAYKKLRFRTREHYDSMLRRIGADCGEKKMADLKAEDIQGFYDGWSLSGASMAHAIMGMFRMLMNFGVTIIEDEECARLSGVLHNMRFKMLKPRDNERLTADQITAIIDKARKMSLYSVALTQAFQADCMLGQRDCIGEWIPESEPAGDSDIHHDGMKWLRGIRWEEVDGNMILHHVTSKRQEEIDINLNKAPLVLAQLRFSYLSTDRKSLPKSGPIIVEEGSGLPYKGWQFRRAWRQVADAAGIPYHIKNMDIRTDGADTATTNGFNFSAEANSPAHVTETTLRRKSGPRLSALSERVIQMSKQYLTGKKGPIATAEIFQFLIEDGGIEFPEDWKTPQYRVHGILHRSRQFRSHGKAGWSMEKGQ
jgi:hypothetical protein